MTYIDVFLILQTRLDYFQTFLGMLLISISWQTVKTIFSIIAERETQSDQLYFRLVYYSIISKYFKKAAHGIFEIVFLIEIPVIIPS